MQTLVAQWFGSHFNELHPQLQHLHIEGGSLKGSVQITYGKSLAGWLGRKIAKKKLGLQPNETSCEYEVNISHEEDALIWSRTLNQHTTITSQFIPYEQYPQGFWLEKVGSLHLHLGVTTPNGEWHWQQKKATLFGLRLPQCLLPSVVAYKKIVDDRYFFSVEFRMKGLGTLLSYSGLLTMVTKHANQTI